MHCNWAQDGGRRQFTQHFTHIGIHVYSVVDIRSHFYKCNFQASSVLFAGFAIFLLFLERKMKRFSSVKIIWIASVSKEIEQNVHVVKHRRRIDWFNLVASDSDRRDSCFQLKSWVFLNSIFAHPIRPMYNWAWDFQSSSPMYFDVTSTVVIWSDGRRIHFPSKIVLTQITLFKIASVHMRCTFLVSYKLKVYTLEDDISRHNVD